MWKMDFTPVDCTDTVITSSVNVTGSVDHWKAGLYIITYEVSDYQAGIIPEKLRFHGNASINYQEPVRKRRLLHINNKLLIFSISPQKK